MNCERGGGKGAVIFNNKPGEFSLRIVRYCDGVLLMQNSQSSGMYKGTLGSESIGIPVMALSLGNGEILLNEHTGETFTIATEEGYAFLSGTSMAAPHVTGAAALIWRSCPACTNQNVTDCLESTAIGKNDHFFRIAKDFFRIKYDSLTLFVSLDLGMTGKDEYFGSGLIQVNAAYKCLSSFSCCAESGSGAASGSGKGPGASSASPRPVSPSPRVAPSMSPTELPAMSFAPTLSCRDKKASCTSDSQCCSKKCKADKKSDTGTCK